MNTDTWTVLNNLRKNGESEMEMDGAVYHSVYIDNARPSDMTPHQFAGHLSALEAKGLYMKDDDPDNHGAFGYVMAQEQPEEQELTPRQKTWALKALGVRISCIYEADPDGNTWIVEFSNGDTEQVMNQSYFRAHDGKEACEREARQIATEKKLEELS